MGLLDDLRQFSNELGPTEEERRRQLREAALTFGIGALGARKGALPQDLSRAGLLAVADYNQGMRDSGNDKLKRLAIAQQLAQWQAQQQQLQQAQELQKRIGGAFTGTGPNLPMMGPGGPTPANAEAVAPVPLADQYRRAAAIAAQGMNPGLAKQYTDLAQAGQKELKDQKTYMKDGKPVVVNFYKDGSHEIVPYQPEPQTELVSLGDRTEAVDKRAVQPGQVWQRGQSPESKASNAIAWANYGLAKNADARAAEAAKAGGKPQWDTAAGMFVYPPTPDNPSGRVVAPEGYQKIDKPLTESQGKNSMYLGMMKSATANIDKLTGLSNSEIALARGDARYVPQFMQNLASPEKAQKYVQSSLQWTEAMLRITTGATAPPEEIVRTSKTFFPQVGDGPEVIAQKAAQRKRMEQLVAIASGKGAGQVENILGGGGGGWSVTEIK